MSKQQKQNHHCEEPLGDAAIHHTFCAKSDAVNCVGWIATLHHAKRGLFAMTVVFIVTACGFSPVYGPKDKTVLVAMNNVAISNIPDRNGQILRNHLIDRLYIKGRPSNPTSRLSVSIRAEESDLAIQKDATASRRELALWAHYSLRTFKGKELVKGTAHSIVSFSKLEAQYGTVTAQRNAYSRALKEASEQITNRLALYFAEGQHQTPVPKYPSFLLPRK